MGRSTPNLASPSAGLFRPWLDDGGIWGTVPYWLITPRPGNRVRVGKGRTEMRGRAKRNEPLTRLRRAERPCQPKEACKPSSVSEMPLVYAPTNRSLLPMAGPAATIYLGPSLPAGSSSQPGDRPDALFPLFGLAPDGVCLASDVTTRAVSSYLAFSPLSA